MPHVHITLSREMLQALLTNLIDMQSLAGEFIVESEIDGINEITRIINLSSGDVFEQAVQKQNNDSQNKECKIYEFAPKTSNNQKDNREE